MNSGTWRSGWWRFSKEIAPEVVARCNRGCRRNPDARKLIGRNYVREAFGGAQCGQRAGLLAVGNGLLLVRATRQAIRHGGHLLHSRHRLASHHPRGRWCHNRRGRQDDDRQDGKQAGEQGPEFHGRKVTCCAVQEKVAALTFSTSGGNTTSRSSSGKASTFVQPEPPQPLDRFQTSTTCSPLNVCSTIRNFASPPYIFQRQHWQQHGPFSSDLSIAY